MGWGSSVVLISCLSETLTFVHRPLSLVRSLARSLALSLAPLARALSSLLSFSSSFFLSLSFSLSLSISLSLCIHIFSLSILPLYSLSLFSFF